MKRLGYAAAAVLTLTTVACASDRNRDVKSAEANLAAEQQEARDEEARLQEKQAREQAEAQQKPMSTEDRLELQTKQQEEKAETTADGAKEIAGADKNVTAAYANMQNERATFEADARARLTKAEARANELKNQSAKVPAVKKAKWTAEWNTFTSKKTEVQNRLTSLSKTTNDEWKDARDKLAKSLDDLDAVVGRLEGQM